MPRMWASIFMAICGLSSSTGCSSEPAHVQDASPQQKHVILSITSLTGGPINGTLPCTDNADRPMSGGQCLPSARALEDAVFACGPSIVAIDRSWTHTEFVTFPVDWRPDAPSSLEVVRCVQRNVGFAFSAAIGTPSIPGIAPEGDDAPFSALHSPQAPER